MQTINVTSDIKGFDVVKDKLYKEVDRKTVLFLSGGKTPVPLYKKFVKEKILKPGAVAIVDERYGSPFHKDSNELMIKNTGLLDYFQSLNIPFYSMLKDGKNRKDLAKDYDELVRYLLSWFPKSVSILGLGGDGHTAGLSVGSNKLSEKNQKYVEEFDNFPAEQKERISLTSNALSQMDMNYLLVFGNDKKKGLKLFLEDGSIEEAPARLLKLPQITDRVTLITDQKV